jgi:hypothetical protein
VNFLILPKNIHSTKLCLLRLSSHQAQLQEGGLVVLGRQASLQPMSQSLGLFPDNCLVAMELSKAVASLATNAFQMGYVKYFPSQTMAKVLYIMVHIARIRRSLHQNALQTVVSIAVTF